jgi:hypothetical protein
MLSVQFPSAVVLQHDSNFKRSAYHATGPLQLQDSEDFPALDLSPEKIYEGHSSGLPKLFAGSPIETPVYGVFDFLEVHLKTMVRRKELHLLHFKHLRLLTGLT